MYYLCIRLQIKHVCLSVCLSLFTLSVLGLGHSQFYHGCGGWALAYHGATPGHLTHVFSKDEFVGMDKAFVKHWLVRKEEKNLSMFLKVCFLSFRHFFITCKHINNFICGYKGARAKILGAQN